MPNPLGSYAPVGNDRLVNSTIAEYQSQPSITFLADGRYVIVFQSYTGGSLEVLGRIFLADGTPSGVDFQVNADAGGEQDLPRVAALADGGFVVVWEELSATGYDIKARVYEADGSVGGEVTVAGSPSGETGPAVAGLPGGGFVVTWTADNDPEGDIAAQICDADATPTLGFAVNGGTTGAQYNANVAVLADGIIAIVWQDAGAGEIRMRLFDSTGGIITGDVLVNSSMAGTAYSPCVAALAGGGFAVAWVDTMADGEGSGIRARLFDADGAPLGIDFVVNTLTAGEQLLPAIAALPDGGFVISWSDGAADSSADDIRAQRFDAGGSPVDAEFVVNSHVDGYQTSPAVAVDPDSGSLVVAWTDQSNPGVGGDNDGGVASRLFTPGGVAPPPPPPPPSPPGVDLNGADPGIDYAAAFAEGDAGAAIGAGIVVTAPGVPITGATITIADAAAGDGLVLAGALPATIAILSGAGTAQLVLAGAGTAADWAAALAQVRYTTASDNPDSFGADPARTISVVVSDGVSQSAPAIASLTIIAVNDNPTTGSIANGAVTWTEGDALVLLDPSGDATVIDPDSANFAGGSLSLGVLTGGSSQDLIFVAATADVSLSGNEVLVGGTAIGTITGQGGGQPLTVSFNAAATAERVQLLLGAIAYTNLGGDDPGAGTRPIAAILTDGDGGATGFGVNVTVTPVNDAPTLIATAADPAFVEGGAAADLFGAVTASTVESGQTFTSMTIGVGNVTDGAGEILRIDGSDVALTDGNSVVTASNGLTVNVSLSGSIATVTFANASLSAAQLQALIGALGYRNSSENPTKASRVVTIVQLDDSGPGSAPDDNLATPNLVSAVDVAAVNDAPSGANSTGTIDEDSIITFSASHFGFSDPLEGDSFAGVRFSAAPTGGKIMFDADGADGAAPVEVTTFPSATYSAADIVAGKLSFVSTLDLNGAGAASVQFQVVDNGGTANGGIDTDPTPNTLTFDIEPVNDLPVIANLDHDDVSLIEGGAAIRIDAGGDALVTDVDSANFEGGSLTVILPEWQPGEDVIGFSTSPETGITLSNGINTGSVVSVNGVAIGSIVTGNSSPASFAINFNANAHPADVSSLLNAVTYQNTNEAHPAVISRAIVFMLADGDGGGTTNLFTTIHVTRVNDAPVNAVPGAQSLNEDDALILSGADAISVADVDAGTSPLRVTISVAHGTLTLSTTSGLTFAAGDGAADATIAFTGTAAAINAALDGLAYTPTADYHGPDSIALTTSDMGQTGTGGTLTDSDSVAVTVNSVGDAPAGADVERTIDEDGSYAFAVADFGFSDPIDGDAFASVVLTTLPLGGAILLDGNSVSAGQAIDVSDIAGGHLIYAPAADASGLGYGSFTFQVRDGGGIAHGGIDTDPAANVFILNVIAVNDAPTATGLQGDLATFTEGDGQVRIDAGTDAVLADVDSVDFAGGKLIVAIGDGVPDEDLLGIRTDSVVTVSGNEIRVSGVSVATMAGGTGGADLVITLGSDATVQDVQEVLGHIAYSNGNADDPTPGQRRLTVTLTDGDGTAYGGLDMLTAISAVDVVAVNDAPEGADVTRTTSEDDPYVLTLADFAITDAEGDALQSVYLTTAPTHGALYVDGTLALADGATMGAALIQAGRVTFVPDADQFGSPYASFTFQLIDDDGGTEPTPNSFTFNVAPDNLAPAVDLNGAGAGGDYAGSYSEGGSAAAIGSAILVSDADEGAGDRIESATVTLTNASAGDRLSYGALPVGITAEITTAAGQIVLTFTGGGSAAVYAALLADVRFATTSDTPAAGDRVFHVVVNDGASVSAGATATISVTATDDAPVAHDHAYTIDEATAIAGSVFADTGGGADADADGPPPSVSAVNGSTANVGQQILLGSGALLTLNANGSFTYDTNHAFDRTPAGDSGASNAAQGDSFTYTLAGGNSATVTLTISGLDSDDTLRGTADSDALSGGEGDDLYYLENAGDRVIELGLQGNDRVVASASWALTGSSEVETLEAASGTDAISLTGNALNQILIGNAGANILHGGGGADILRGLGGDDTYYTDVAATLVQEAAGDGTDRLFTSVSYVLAAGSEVELLSTNSHNATGAINLTGNGFGQTLIGNSGSNVLHGGGGTDLLIGLAGRDIYYIDVAATEIVEYEGGGNDVLYVSLSFVLANGEVETLSTNNYGSTAAINLTGNLYNQTLIGNAGVNILQGGGGADLLIGLGGNDLYYVDVAATQVIEYEGGGSDTVYVSTSYALGGSAEVETLSANDYAATTAINLTGNVYSQVLIGNAGANTLHGGGGVDTLIGLGGNDIYYVDVAGTQAYEAAGAGTDTVYTSVSLALAAGSEIETLSSNNYGATAALSLTGNASAQTVIGNAGANALDGGAGADTLLGLSGADIFRFTTALGGGNVDSIGDFSVVDDTIALDDAVFTTIGGPGALNANAFATGVAAADADDRIIYNSATGQLFYDADGKGGGSAVQFATLATGLALTASDFTVI